MTRTFNDTEVLFAYFSCDSGGGDIQLPGPAVEVQYSMCNKCTRTALILPTFININLMIFFLFL